MVLDRPVSHSRYPAEPPKALRPYPTEPLACENRQKLHNHCISQSKLAKFFGIDANGDKILFSSRSNMALRKIIKICGFKISKGNLDSDFGKTSWLHPENSRGKFKNRWVLVQKKSEKKLKIIQIQNSRQNWKINAKFQKFNYWKKNYLWTFKTLFLDKNCRNTSQKIQWSQESKTQKYPV